MLYIVYREEEERRSEKRKAQNHNSKLKIRTKKPEALFVLRIVYRVSREERRR